MLRVLFFNYNFRPEHRTYRSTLRSRMFCTVCVLNSQPYRVRVPRCDNVLMSDPLESSRRKFARAEEHFDSLQREVSAFEYSNPYERVVEAHPDKPDHVLHKIISGPLQSEQESRSD